MTIDSSSLETLHISTAEQAIKSRKVCENLLYTTSEAAEVLGLSISTIKRWIYSGKLIPRRHGKRKLFVLGRDLLAQCEVVGVYREEAARLQKPE